MPSPSVGRSFGRSVVVVVVVSCNGGQPLNPRTPSLRPLFPGLFHVLFTANTRRLCAKRSTARAYAYPTSHDAASARTRTRNVKERRAKHRAHPTPGSPGQTLALRSRGGSVTLRHLLSRFLLCHMDRCRTRARKRVRCCRFYLPDGGTLHCLLSQTRASTRSRERQL